eukprot:487452-Pleurochrysis_carterae.AAC.1
MSAGVPLDSQKFIEMFTDVFATSNQKKNRKKGEASSSAADGEKAAEMEPKEVKLWEEEIEKLKTCHAEELKRVKDEYKQKLKQQEADLLHEIEEAESESNKARQEM